MGLLGVLLTWRDDRTAGGPKKTLFVARPAKDHSLQEKLSKVLPVGASNHNNGNQ